MFAAAYKPPRLVATALLVAIATSLLSACTSLSLAVANLPAVFGSYELRHDIKYGVLERNTLDVYIPERTDTTPRPIVVFVHGGGWVNGSKGDYRFIAEALTSRGFVAVIPNYRLYPEVKFPDFVDDIAQAVAWAHQHAAEFGGDASRLFAMGHSAGAQITALIAYNDQYLKRVGGDPCWLRGFIGLAGPYDFLPFTDAYLQDVFGPESKYPLSQPVNFVKENAVPALLLHGDADQVVWPSNSKSLAERLRKHDVRVVERYYPEMGHTSVLAALSVYFRDRRSLLEEIESFILEKEAAVLTLRR